MKRLVKVCSLSIYLAIATQVAFSNAQSIIIDNTTETTPTICSGNCVIRGETIVGNNLFHSFSEFNVNTSSRVDFIDPGVINIITRVTGPNISSILGELAISGGDANLFIMNPNGIIFGPSSSLDIRGSLFATTSNAIRFGSSGSLQASKTTISPELNINPSALLFTATKPKSIINQSKSSVNDILKIQETGVKLFGLDVPIGRSISLLGGDIYLDGGGINAFGGQVNLGGISEPGIIKFKKQGWRITLDYPNNKLLANVTLSKGASVNTIGNNGGFIDVTANNINLYDGSRLFSGLAPNQVSTSTIPGDISITSKNQVLLLNNSTINNVLLFGSKGKSGNIYINANSLKLNNASLQTLNLNSDGVLGNVEVNVNEGVSLVKSRINSLLFLPQSQGAGGNVNIKSNILLLDDRSFIETSTYGKGDAGDINLAINDSLFLLSRSLITSNVQTTGIGNGGKININTKLLSLEGGSQISASILPKVLMSNPSRPDLRPGPGGKGRGGDIRIYSDIVNITGFSSESGFSSGIFVATESGAEGPAGNIAIDSIKFNISDGAIINAQTLNSSFGGNVSIKSIFFNALRGGQITTSASSSGNAGSITFDVKESIVLSGSDPNFESRKFKFKGVVQNEGPASGIFASTRLGSSGSAGNIIIDPILVLIEDGAQISVNSEGSGVGGSVILHSKNLSLDRGNISATSNNNAGGNIFLFIDNLLLLRNNSQISATAAGDGTGGNIDINADLIVAFPTENSDITANAFDGRGGRITITTKGIFGLEIRDQLTESSDITAFSKNNPQLNGTVEINNPEIDPGENLSEQPETVEPPQEIAKGCRPGQTLGNSSFTHVGRGGLPLGPHQTQTPTTVWQDLRAHNLQPTPTATTETSPSSLTPNSPPTIIEAKGWTKDPQGRIYLTASVPQSAQNPQPAVTC